jgi:hypothetical protein
MIFLYDIISFERNSSEVEDFNVLAHTPFKKLFNESKANNGVAGL